MDKPYSVSQDKNGMWYVHKTGFAYIPVLGSFCASKRQADNICKQHNNEEKLVVPTREHEVMQAIRAIYLTLEKAELLIDVDIDEAIIIKDYKGGSTYDLEECFKYLKGLKAGGKLD